MTERARSPAAALAGPALIVAAVAFTLFPFVAGRLSDQHVDFLSFSLPMNCLMGRSLAAGHILAWDPFAMAGRPFVADPLSGWLNLPVMGLFTAFGCGRAMSLLVVVRPLIAGLGMYGFLRVEGVSRPAATVGGLVMTAPYTAAVMGVYLPFGDLVAWIPAMLAAASKTLGSSGWPARLGWIAATALAFGQVSAAYPGIGPIIGILTLAGYGAVRTLAAVRGGTLPLHRAAALWGILLVALPIVNLGVFLPRLLHISGTSIGLGYDGMERAAAGLSGLPYVAPPIPAEPPTWPLKLAGSTGAYLGAIPLVLSFAALASRRLRPSAAGVAMAGLAAYVASLGVVARVIARILPTSSPIFDTYLHSPQRFSIALLAPLAGMAGLGVEALREARRWPDRLAMAAPGLVVWGLLPPLFGVPASRVALLVAGIAVGGAVLAASVRVPALFLCLPVVLAAELSVNALANRHLAGPPGRPFHAPTVLTEPLLAPTVDAGSYLHPGPIVSAIRAGEPARFLGLDRTHLTHRGYLNVQGPTEWGALVNQRGTLFGLEDAQGYSSIQDEGYWRFVRAVAPRRLDYNASVFGRPSALVRDLLQIGWIVQPAAEAAPAGSFPVVRDGPWIVYRLPSTPRASLVTEWSVVPGDADAALSRMLRRSFDPRARILLDHDPGIAEPGDAGVGWADYTALGKQAARVQVSAPSGGVVLVRNVFDPNWRATVDGRPASVLLADSFLQGVAVGPGRHEIVLRYDDPAIGYSLLVSGLALAALLGTGGALAVRARHRDG